MRSRAYIERICRELLARSPQQVEVEMRGLIGIFERIQSLPSPEKEERFITLLLDETLDRSSIDESGALAA